MTWCLLAFVLHTVWRLHTGTVSAQSKIGGRNMIKAFPDESSALTKLFSLGQKHCVWLVMRRLK